MRHGHVAYDVGGGLAVPEKLGVSLRVAARWVPPRESHPPAYFGFRFQNTRPGISF